MDSRAAPIVASRKPTQDLNAFRFGQRGLMASLVLEKPKITRIQPGP
jgi:hypothetical protein